MAMKKVPESSPVINSSGCRNKGTNNRWRPGRITRIK